MKKFSFVLVALFLFLSPGLINAHQPRLIDEQLTDIENPEISQAFYARLEGEPDYYQIESTESFKLYVGLLVPDISDVDKDYSAEIYKEDDHIHDISELTLEHEEETPLFIIDGIDFEWTYYFEEFGGDGYFSGPELRANESKEELPEGIQVEAGIYIIKVFSTDNLGKYVLVVGEKEAFPVKDMLETLVTLPKLKRDFFGKSPFTAYFNLVGVFLFVFVILITGFIALTVWGLKKYTKKRR